ncbi:24566_t:CDS:2 [Entrophospora sp. SA101]|nr:7682_t:CDS:2 [Entrophospora sp. SA101]CAJ0756634.1 24566_t:CDS:2 [Entrophospora sp. SA101]
MEDGQNIERETFIEFNILANSRDEMLLVILDLLVLQSFGNEQQNYNSNQDDGDEGESDHDDTLSEKVD